jgi:hypothetical protein
MLSCGYYAMWENVLFTCILGTCHECTNWKEQVRCGIRLYMLCVVTFVV